MTRSWWSVGLSRKRAPRLRPEVIKSRENGVYKDPKAAGSTRRGVSRKVSGGGWLGNYAL